VKILVTGGSGALGSVLVKAFIDKGNTVRVLALPGDVGAEGLAALGVEVRAGDVADAASVAGAAEGCDTVYHLAAVIIAWDDRVYERVNVGGTANVVEEARRAGVRHLVHVSSASVVYPRSTPYSRSKQAAERIVRESGLAWTIVRPTLVYGKRGGQEFDDYLAYLRRFAVVPFVGNGAARKRPVYVDDVVSGLAAIAGRERTRGAVYNLSGGESISMRDFSRLCLRLMGMGGKPILHLPVWLCRALALCMGVVQEHPALRWPVIAGVTQDADLDPQGAMDDLGYRPARVSEKLQECFPRETQ
jgi:NADH dehydrogenase